MKEVNTGLREYFKLYNEERFHQGLDERTPDHVYFDHPAETTPKVLVNANWKNLSMLSNRSLETCLHTWHSI